MSGLSENVFGRRIKVNEKPGIIPGNLGIIWNTSNSQNEDMSPDSQPRQWVSVHLAQIDAACAYMPKSQQAKGVTENLMQRN